MSSFALLAEEEGFEPPHPFRDGLGLANRHVTGLRHSSPKNTKAAISGGVCVEHLVGWLAYVLLGHIAAGHARA